MTLFIHHDFLLALRRLMPIILLAGFTAFAPMDAQAQVNPEIANCEEIKDEGTQFQADICSAHIGCRFVLNIIKTCTRAKSFLERLKTAIGEGPRNFLDIRSKEVTPDALFTAVAGDEVGKVAQDKIAGNPESQPRSQFIAEKVREIEKANTVTGKAGTVTWVIYGQSKQAGQIDGWGTRVASNGEVAQGHFKNSDLHGPGTILFPSGDRFVGAYENAERSGKGFYAFKNGATVDGTWEKKGSEVRGTFTRPDGAYFEGTLKGGTKPIQGKFYLADGRLAEEGSYENEKLSVGTKYDASGTATEVNLPRDRLLAEREAAEKKRLAMDAEEQKKRETAELVRLIDEAEQQRRREDAARAEQQFRDSLTTMNPGQLFVRADELSAQGNQTRAREVLRTLVSKYPDHALAATAAQKMSGTASTQEAPKSNAGQAAAKPASAYSSICVRNLEKIDQVLSKSGLKNYPAYGDRYHARAGRLLSEIAAPCASQDARAAQLLTRYKEGIAQHEKYCASNQYGPCTEWGSGGNEDENQAWFRAFQREAQAALSNPNGYSADLETGQQQRPVTRQGGSMSAQTCRAKELEIQGTMVPSNAGITSSTETVMYLTKTAMEMIDGGCQDAGGAEKRKSLQNAYNSAEQACNAVQSGNRKCTASNYFGPGSKSTK